MSTARAVIEELRDDQVAAYNAALAGVIRERQYLFMLEAPRLELSLAYVRRCRDHGGVSLIAQVSGEVVGWCDIARHGPPFDHGGQLGIGVSAAYRDRGIGRQLLQAAVEDAWTKGLSRIELKVYSRNERAIALYEKVGFAREGLMRNAAFIDGTFLDVVLMSLLQLETRKE